MNIFLVYTTWNKILSTCPDVQCNMFGVPQAIVIGGVFAGPCPKTRVHYANISERLVKVIVVELYLL